jgi:glycosyltransferase involved in cell wall biosynthesis
LWARELARSEVRVVVTQHNPMSCVVTTWKWKRRYFPALIRRKYQTADAIVAVSQGVADDLALSAGIPGDRITVVHNPIVPEDLEKKAAAKIDHPWFAAEAPPVVLAVGRLDLTKDHPTLIQAFARLRRAREAKLVILGAGKSAEATARHRTELMGQAAGLGLPSNDQGLWQGGNHAGESDDDDVPGTQW